MLLFATSREVFAMSRNVLVSIRHKCDRRIRQLARDNNKSRAKVCDRKNVSASSTRRRVDRRFCFSCVADLTFTIQGPIQDTPWSSPKPPSLSFSCQAKLRPGPADKLSNAELLWPFNRLWPDIRRKSRARKVRNLSVLLFPKIPRPSLLGMTFPWRMKTVATTWYVKIAWSDIFEYFSPKTHAILCGVVLWIIILGCRNSQDDKGEDGSCH